MRRPGASFAAILLLAGPSFAAEPQPHGCWAIRDTVERVACFDLALGPPVFGRAADQPSPVRDRPPEATAARPVLQPGTATRD